MKLSYNSYRDNVALSTGDHKQAALFFDKILPLHSSKTVPSEIREYVKFPHEEEDRIFNEVIESTYEAQRSIVHHYVNKYTILNGYSMNMATAHNPQRNIYEDLMSSWNKKGLVQRVLSYGKTNENKIVTPLLDNRLTENSFLVEGTENVVELILTNLNLVDTAKLEWDHIIEYKKDSNSVSALRNMRLFVFKNYDGKPAGFILDDIDSILNKYEVACKKHGFDMFSSSLSILLNSKSLLATVGLGTVATLLGLPMSAITPAIVAESLLEAGKISINIAQKKKELSLVRLNHPLAYVLDLPMAKREEQQ